MALEDDDLTVTIKVVKARRKIFFEKHFVEFELCEIKNDYE